MPARYETPRAAGHDGVRDRFRCTLERGRLASTYLFGGPEGIGKRLFADELAAAALCPRVEWGPRAELDANDDAARLAPCGDCESCRLMASGSHPDLLRIAKPEGKSTLSIDLFLGAADQRNRAGLCHDIALRPFVGRRRVAVIDDADDLSVESANCLLKTLEEPPPGSLMILLGTSLGKQLPTIRSRSQVVRFNALGVEQVAGVLATLPEGPEPEEARRLAERSGGSVSRAIDLRDEALGAARSAVVDCLKADEIDPLRLTALLDEQSKASGTEPSLRRRLLREMFAAAVDHYRDRLRSEAMGGEPVDTTFRLLEACLAAEESLGRNANQSALVQSLATGLWRIQRSASATV